MSLILVYRDRCGPSKGSRLALADWLIDIAQVPVRSGPMCAVLLLWTILSATGSTYVPPVPAVGGQRSTSRLGNDVHDQRVSDPHPF